MRTTSNVLDLQIRETLTLLTDTRRALLDTPSTIFPENTNPVSYSELLNYARRISKFTLPATYRESEEASDGAARQGSPTPKESKPETQTNGSAPSAAVTNGVEKDTQVIGIGSGSDVDGATASNSGAQNPQGTTTTTTLLPQDFTQYLNSSTEIPFIPWPTEETIRKGALASIQVLLDKDIDPATFDPEKSSELEAERKRIAEEEDRMREEQKAQLEDINKKEMERRASASGLAATNRTEQERPRVFQLEEFDEDDSE